jgi:hypothetical protein
MTTWTTRPSTSQADRDLLEDLGLAEDPDPDQADDPVLLHIEDATPT